MHQAVLRAAQLVRRHKRVATLLLYAAITAVGYTLAFHITFGFAVPAVYAAVLAPTLLLLVVLRMTSFAFFRLDRTTWRFAGMSDVLRLGGCTLAGTLALLMLSEAGTLRLQIPRIVIVLEAGITANLTAAVWIFYRVGYEYGRKHGQAPHPKRALIAGAGEAGHLLAHEIERSALGYQLVGFIDDDPAKLHMELCGAPVLGTMAQLDEIVRRTGADELLISTRWSDQKMLLRATEASEHTGLRIKLLPAFTDLVRGEGLLAHLRDLRLE
jgi:FlaA1/EpsC-like NDP-sugar epimerase